MNKKIVFLGAGSMAEALIAGIRANNDHKTDIWVTNRSNDLQLSHLKERYSVIPCRDMAILLKDADVVLIAVKPKDVLAVLELANPFLSDQTLLISVAAGISTDTLESITKKPMPIIRAMPNTSAAVGKSATALSGNRYVQLKDRSLAERIFNTVGMSVYTTEEKMNAVTGLSGSGPAYIYYLIEAMEQSAKQIGLEATEAKSLIIQTLLGAAEMVKASSKSPETLRMDVTSPGGTTEAGVRILENNQVKRTFIDCIQEATNQSERMGKELAQKIDQELLKR